MKVMNYKHKNQFVILDGYNIIFQSYNSTIAMIDKDCELTLYEDYNYSKTTSKHLNEFLMEYEWEGRSQFIILKQIKKYSVTKALEYMIKKGLIIKGW